MVRCLDTLLEKEGYGNVVVHESMKLLGDLDRFRKLHLPEKRLSGEVARFLDTHSKALCQVESGKSIDDEESKRWVADWRSDDIESGSNPLATEVWTDILGGMKDEALSAYGYIPAEVYFRPKEVSGKYRGYLFARDKNDTEYFIKEEVLGLSKTEYQAIKLGDMLQVKPHSGKSTEQATPVIDAQLVS